MTVHVRDHKTIDSAALAQIFTEARTHNVFLDRPVGDELLHKAIELAKMGPTSANQSPMRVLYLRSQAAKERLRPALSPGNLDKTMSAPVVAITAYDAEFFPEGRVKSNVLINIGYGDSSKLFPRNPRLPFDQMAKIL